MPSVRCRGRHGSTRSHDMNNEQDELGHGESNQHRLRDRISTDITPRPQGGDLPTKEEQKERGDEEEEEEQQQRKKRKKERKKERRKRKVGLL